MFWNSLTVQTYGMTVVELSHIFRQTDPEFTALLNRVRVAEDLPNTLREMNALGAPSTEKPSPLITLTATNQVAENINHSHLQALPGKLLCANARIEGDFRLDVSHLPSPENLYLKQGAQVMFTRNGEGGLWVNGTLGRVLDVRESKPHPEVIVEILSSLTTPHQHNTQVSVIPVKWEIFKYRVDEKTDKIVPEVIGSYQQYPLMLAWAVTIHKSQGKTLERVCVNLGNGAFASGQVYTALSRCRSIQDLTFETPINPSDIICDPHVGRFFADLQEDSISYEQVVIQRYGTPSRVTFSRWDFHQKEREEEEGED
jgi:ATP-dependent DNA helicase PIF1